MCIFHELLKYPTKIFLFIRKLHTHRRQSLNLIHHVAPASCMSANLGPDGSTTHSAPCWWLGRQWEGHPPMAKCLDPRTYVGDPGKDCLLAPDQQLLAAAEILGSE